MFRMIHQKPPRLWLYPPPMCGGNRCVNQLKTGHQYMDIMRPQQSAHGKGKRKRYLVNIRHPPTNIATKIFSTCFPIFVNLKKMIFLLLLLLDFFLNFFIFLPKDFEFLPTYLPPLKNTLQEHSQRPYWDGVNCVSVSLDRYRALVDLELLSSPRAESARAVTGRRCPHSGVGEDFLVHQPGPLTKTGVTQERKVVDQIRWSQNLRNDLGYPGFSAKKQVSI